LAFVGVHGVVSQKIELIYYHVRKIPSIGPSFTSCFSKTHFNTIRNMEAMLNAVLNPALVTVIMVMFALLSHHPRINISRYPISKEAGWAPEPIGTRAKK
jgi:hypothetical protein